MFNISSRVNLTTTRCFPLALCFSLADGGGACNLPLPIAVTDIMSLPTRLLDYTKVRLQFWIQDLVLFGFILEKGRLECLTHI